MTDDRNNEPKTTGRTPSGRFGPGNPGRPKGARHKSTLAILALMEGEAESITRTCIEAAKAGDLTAIRLVLDRLLPPAKERPLRVKLPDVVSLEDVAQAQAAILKAVAAGELLPTEGATLAGIVESRRKAIETAELEARVSALESKQ